MADVSFLLGAGFSIPAGYPTTKDINNKFSELLESQIYIHTDMTAFFIDNKPDAPRLQYVDELFMEKFIQFYHQEVIDGGDFYYERFYDYYHKQYRENSYSPSLSNFLGTFQKDYKVKKDFLNMLNHFNTYFNQLLSSILLKWEHTDDQLWKYVGFKNLVLDLVEEKIVHVHSLNHDLLFESLASKIITGNFSDGFKELSSPYFGDIDSNKVRLQYFTDEYEESLRLYKLHGSVDMYQYHYDGITDMIRTKKGLRSDNFLKEIIDASGKPTYHNHWTELSPRFLSGAKEKILNYDRLYFKEVMDRYLQNLRSSDTLIVIGYGFGDSWINEMLMSEFISQGKKVIIINPSTPNQDFYHSMISEENVRHYFKSVDEIDSNEVLKMLG